VESIRKFLIKHSVLIFVLAVGSVAILSFLSVTNLSSLYERHLRYITTLAGRNLHYTFSIYYNDMLVKQNLKTLKEEIKSAQLVYLQLASKEYFYPEGKEDYQKLFELCKTASSDEVFHTERGILVCYPLYGEFASQFITENRKEGLFAVLYSKKTIDTLIIQWLFQDIVLFIIFAILGGFLFFDMLLRINRNFNTLNSMITHIERLLEEKKFLSDSENAVKQCLYQFSFKEFQNAGQLIGKLIKRIAKLTEELQRQAIKDSLTNLYNRNYLNQFVNKIVGIVQRQKFPLSIAMLDIDDFKLVNDTFGHLKGDEVLKSWGEIILGSIRNSDIAVRYGGEEVLLVFPNTKKEAVFYIVDRIKKKFSEVDFGIGKKITFSAGVAGFPEDIPELRSLGDLIEIADRRLYIAKKNGKNRIVIEDLEE